jgi:hypothetical protein
MTDDVPGCQVSSLSIYYSFPTVIAHVFDRMLQFQWARVQRMRDTHRERERDTKRERRRREERKGESEKKEGESGGGGRGRRV